MSFRRQIALSYLLLVGLCLGLPGNLYLSWYRDSETERFQRGLMQHARFLAGLLRTQSTSSLNRELTSLALTLNARIQIVGLEGRLYFDSRNPRGISKRGPVEIPITQPLRLALAGQSTSRVVRTPPEDRLPQEPTLISTMVLVVPIKPGLALIITRSLLDVELRLLEFETALLKAVLLSLSLAAVAGFLMSKWLAKPLLDLHQQARGLSQGTVEHVAVDSPAELRDLARHFNEMAAELKLQAEVMRHFLGDASHELKTPLASLSALSDAVETAAHDDPERVASLASLMRQEALRLGKLVDTLLTLHRLESDSVAPSESFCLLALARNCAEQMSAANPVVEIQVQGEPVTVKASRDAFKQVILNLLSNAQRAVRESPEPSISLTVRKDKATVLEVQDNGVGLSCEQLERVFDRFYRVDQARARKDGGHGLGLTIAHRIVKHHNGELRAQSQPGQGSCFSVHLP